MVTATAPAVKPAAPATPPATKAAPVFGEKFIGQKLIHQNLTPYGYNDWDAFGTKLVGEREGYQSLSDAMAAARQLAPWDKGKISNAVAILRNDSSDKFAVMELDKPLVFRENGKLVAANEFRWYSPAVVGAINGAGGVLENKGKVRWWN